MSTAKSYVHLTGGLGNQLFQLAFACTRKKQAIVIESVLGKPRLNLSSNPDYSDFNFPFDFELRHTKQNRIYGKFMSKAAGYVLRQGLEPRGVERFTFFTSATKILASIVLSIGYFERLKVIQATDNGYCNLPGKEGSEYLIGYFQSYRWLHELSNDKSFRNIELINPSAHLLNFLDQIKDKSTVMVHIRLGDYLNEPTFGIPSKEYYKEALTQIREKVAFDNIVLFSNEPNVGITFIPENLQNKVIVAPDFSGSAAETLEAMRNMNAYVIGNSSLSWWAASLRYRVNSEVYCPTPWFKAKPEPKDLIPNDWKRIRGWPNEQNE